MDQRTSAGLRRTGLAHRALLLVVPLLLVGVLAVGWSVFGRGTNSADEDAPMMHVVDRDDFIHEITERGNVESASNIEVRCEVQSQGSAGTRILEIVPEGTYVKQGDVICRLDSSAFETERMKQETVFHTAQAALIQAENDFETAKIAKDEYQNGQFSLDEQTIQSEIMLAEENRRKAEDYLKFSDRLRKKGFISGIQYEADKFASEKSKKDLEAAKQKLMVLQKYTERKNLGELESNIRSGEAKLAAQKATRDLEKKRLDIIVAQIEKCTVKAPEDGQVVYASSTESSRYYSGSSDVLIEEGAMVRERQVIVKLPDTKRMQVKAKVNESKIALVRPGQPVSIRLDAFPEAELTGVVEKVSEYPAQGAYWMANVKEYDTIIRILDSSIALRPGYTAEVRIRVAHQSNALLAPIQALLEQGGQYYCVVRGDSGWEAREVKVSQTNDKFAVIDSGLDDGDSIVLAAASLRDRLGLPEETPEPASPHAKSEAEQKKRAPDTDRQGPLRALQIFSESEEHNQPEGSKRGPREKGERGREDRPREDRPREDRPRADRPRSGGPS